MADVDYPYIDDFSTDMVVDFLTASDAIFTDFTIEKIILGESLLTPGLQTSIEVSSYVQSLPVKDIDTFKNSDVSITLTKPILGVYGRPKSMEIVQKVYRVENRRRINTNIEQFTIRACDATMLNDAASTVSKSWKCTQPSEIVADILRTCAGARTLDIETADPARDYIAENIHPFQVVSQQCNVSLANGNDPSFIHYMTYENLGTHHFRSLYSLTRKSPIQKFTEYETGIVKAGMVDPSHVMSYQFPCDFDLLTDILNGVGPDGKDINSLIVFNPVNKMFSLTGDQTVGCGLGSGVVKMAQTNRNTAQQQNSCNSDVEKYLLKRQARMSLIDRDKIALRMTVPFDPSLHVGEVVEFNLYNKQALAAGQFAKNYGSGRYLIMNMFHEVRRGGYAVTNMDCVSSTVGTGVV